jgi:hypothetical protein
VLGWLGLVGVACLWGMARVGVASRGVACWRMGWLGEGAWPAWCGRGLSRAWLNGGHCWTRGMVWWLWWRGLLAHLILRKMLSRSRFISTSVRVWCRKRSFICCRRALDRLLKLSSISLVFSKRSSLGGMRPPVPAS